MAKKTVPGSSSPSTRSRSRATAKASPPAQIKDEASDMQTPRVTVPDDSAPYNPSDPEIAEAAYHRYLSRGGSHGLELDDWLEAERELRSRQRR